MSYSVNQGVVNVGNLAAIAAQAPCWGVLNGQLQQQQQIYGGGVLGGGGITLLGGHGQNYGHANNMEMLQQITKELYKNCPTDITNVQDAIYPYDLPLSSPHMQFHLIVWRYSTEENKRNFWDMIELPNRIFDFGSDTANIEGNITFLSRKARRDFVNWWVSYSNRFYEGIPPINTFLPRIRPGKITGVFVENRTMLDQLPYDFKMNPTLIHNLTRGLLEALPAWTWIVQNCKKPVCHHSGGWFFSSGTEGAKFALFNPTKSGETT